MRSRYLLVILSLFFLTTCEQTEDVPPEPPVISDLAICEGINLVEISNAFLLTDCTETGLRDAIEQYDTIQCDCPEGIVFSNAIEIYSDVVLDGGYATFDGNGVTRIFIKQPGATFTLQNALLTNGRAPDIPNVFDKSGGLILARGNDTGMAEGGDLTCINVTFTEGVTSALNENDVAGGAVYVFNVPRATFSDCLFINNQSSNGGAIGGLGSDLILINTSFQNNRALGTTGPLTGHGGAINIDGVALSGQEGIYSVCGCRFIGNTATKQGGATNAVISDGLGTQAVFDRCTFEDNKVGDETMGNGGAIFHLEDDNQGGAGSEESNFSLINSTFSNNEAGRQGGGLWIIIDGRGTLENCTFDGNQALNAGGSLGGAIAFSSDGYGGNYTLTHCTFSENATQHFGGGIFGANNNQITLNNSLLYLNTGTFEFEGHQIAGPADYEGEANLQFPTTRFNGSVDQVVP
ncbi:MAG: hypothetical protein ACFB0B_14350, partial [Thermonemataceae bacterium]